MKNAKMTCNVRIATGAVRALGCLAIMTILGARTAFAAGTASVSGTVLTIDVPLDEGYVFTDEVPVSITEIVKTGAGSCEMAPSSIVFTGTMDVREGVMHGDRGKFGVPKLWKVAPGATLRFDTATGDDYSADEWGKPSGKLEIGGFGCDGCPAYSFPMLPDGDPYTTSHGNFVGGVKLTSDASVGGGRFGLAAMDMQGHDLYTFCTNGQAQYEMYADIANPGDIRVKKGEVLLERAMAFSPAITDQAYVLANGTAIRMYGHPSDPLVGQAATMNVELEDDASAQIICTGADTDGLSAGDNVWFGDWRLGNGTNLTLRSDSWHPGSMRGSIDASKVELRKEGPGSYTITSNGTHRIHRVVVGQGTLALGANGDGSDYVISNVWKVSGAATGGDVARISFGPNARVYSDPKSKIDNAGIRIAASWKGGAPQYGVVEVADGAVVTNAFQIGDAGDKVVSVGALYLGDATVYWRAGAGHDGYIGKAVNGYGYLLQNGGTFTQQGYMNLGSTGGGCVDQRGGVHRILTADPLKFAQTGSKSWGCYHLSGGVFEGETSWFNYNGAATNGVSAVSVLTVNGATSRFTCKDMKAYMSRNAIDTYVNVNDGATLQGRLYREINFKGYDPAHWLTFAPQMTNTTHLYVNLNGGILKSLAASDGIDLWGSDRMRGPTRATVYEKGVTFDTSEKDIELNTELVRPFGKGVASISLAGAPEDVTAGNRYLASPRVRITSKTGTGASAYAVFDEKERKVSGIEISSAGCGYGDVTVQIDDVSLGQVTLDKAATLEELSATGGVRKIGSGRLTFNCANTYGGTTRIEGGTLEFAHADGMPGGDVEFAAAAVFATAAGTPLLTARALKLNAGAKLRVTGIDAFETGAFREMRTLVSVSTPMVTMPDVELVNAAGEVVPSDGWRFELSEDRRTLAFGAAKRGFLMILR